MNRVGICGGSVDKTSKDKSSFPNAATEMSVQRVTHSPTQQSS